MRISDWSSDVCSSDLQQRRLDLRQHALIKAVRGKRPVIGGEQPRKIKLHGLAERAGRLAQTLLVLDAFQQPLLHGAGGYRLLAAEGGKATHQIFEFPDIARPGDRKSTRLNSSH